MTKTKITLAERTALLKLNNEHCKVKLKGWGSVFTTNGKLKKLNESDNQYTKIIELDEWYNIHQITHIEVGNRFNENIKSMMEIAWEN